MLTLVLNVCHHVRKGALAERQNPVFALPGERLLAFGTILMIHGIRRRTLQPLDDLRDKNARRNGRNNMHVVRHHADRVGYDVHRIQRRLNRPTNDALLSLTNQWLPSSRRPNEVIEKPPIRHLLPPKVVVGLLQPGALWALSGSARGLNPGRRGRRCGRRNPFTPPSPPTQ